MNRKIESVPAVVPPALDVFETELAARNEFLADKDSTGERPMDEFINDPEETGEIALGEADGGGGDDTAAGGAPEGLADERENKAARSAKRRRSVMFLAMFGACFGLFAVFLAWAFGLGFFAPSRSIAVDRNQKINGANISPTAAAGDEKLKTALTLVASGGGDAAAAGNNKDAPVISANITDPNAVSEQELKISSRELTPDTKYQNDLQPGNVIVLPDESSLVKSNPAQDQGRVHRPPPPPLLTQGAMHSPPAANVSTGDDAPANAIFQPRSNNAKPTVTDRPDGAVGRSIFFGTPPVKNNSVSKSNDDKSGNSTPQRFVSSNRTANVPAFGTLLPVRLLGAIYTLRGSGGLVRMELSRGVKKGEFSCPAGTVLIGRLRGSEYNRAFISVDGSIDPKSRRLIKFEGEVLGVDGASGVVGTRKSVKSWAARFLEGMREAGGHAINALAARGGGGGVDGGVGGRSGAIILGGTSSLGREMSSVIRVDPRENSFVAVKAGTEGYVLVTDLPGEQRSDDLDESERRSGSTISSGGGGEKLPGVNLSESEIAEFLSTDDAGKIRGALLKMSPELRALAVKAMEEGR